MTDQHRATAEQWEFQKVWAVHDDDSSCLLELRDRIEQLEAAQRPNPAPTGAPTGSLVERVESRAGGDARAAIREVAAWLDEWNESVIQEARDSQPIPDPCGPSDDLTAGEAIDRLRDEANR
jgi:hypothetical protein